MGRKPTTSGRDSPNKMSGCKNSTEHSSHLQSSSWTPSSVQLSCDRIAFSNGNHARTDRQIGGHFRVADRPKVTPWSQVAQG